jgi:hypothetical protein
MLKRIFLAGTLAFPLYLMIAIKQSPPLADSLVRSSDLPERVTPKIDRKMKDFQQQLQQVRSALGEKIEGIWGEKD